MQNNQVRNSWFEAHDRKSISQLGGHHFCTDNELVPHRLAWLKEVIGREYANVEVTPYKNESIYNDMVIYPWQNGVRLSPIKTNSLQIERLASEPTEIEQDNYFAVLLTSGKYKLEQGGREVFLEPGDMALYDATQWHRITIPQSASKILITIPRKVLNERINGVANLTAKKISSKLGIGAVTSSYIQTTVNQLDHIDKASFLEMTEPVLDSLTLSLNQLNPRSFQLSGTQSSTLFHVKKHIQKHCCDSELNPEVISQAVGLSVRYINHLFNAEETSLMRYVTQQRLALVHRHLSSKRYVHCSITELAMQFGFNNMAHFSRVFKTKYGMSPRQFRDQMIAISTNL